MKLTEFRKKYPMYNHIPDQVLAGQLHGRFYSKIPIDKFYKDIGVEKPTDTPVYQKQPPLPDHPAQPTVLQENIPHFTPFGMGITQEGGAPQHPANWQESAAGLPEQIKGSSKESLGGAMQMAVSEPPGPIPSEASRAPFLTAFSQPFTRMLSPTVPTSINEPSPEDSPLTRTVKRLGQEFANRGKQIASEGTAERKLATPPNQTFWQQAVSSGLQSAAQTAPSMAAFAFTRNPQFASRFLIGQFGVQEAGRAYDEARKAGLPEHEALRHAAISGVAEAGTELLPAKALFARDLNAFKRLVNFMSAELPGENMAEISQTLSEQLHGLNDDVTVKDLIDTIKLTSAATMVGGGAQVSVSHYINKINDSLESRSRDKRADEIRKYLAEQQALDSLRPETTVEPKPFAIRPEYQEGIVTPGTERIVKQLDTEKAFIDKETKENKLTEEEQAKKPQDLEQAIYDMAMQEPSLKYLRTKIGKKLPELISKLDKAQQQRYIDVPAAPNTAMADALRKALFADVPEQKQQKTYSRYEPTSLTDDLTGDQADPAFEQFLEKGKPLLLTSIKGMESLGIKDRVFEETKNPPLKSTGFDGNELLIFYQPGKLNQAKKLKQLYDNKDSQNPEWHRNVGKLLGYPDNEIDAFISDYFSLPKPKGSRPVEINQEKDNILNAISKLGGLSREEASAQGIDPAHFKERMGGNRPVFPKTGGRSMDDLAQALSQYGYFKPDEEIGANTLLDKIGRQLGGEDILTPKGIEAKAERELSSPEYDEFADIAIELNADLDQVTPIDRNLAAAIDKAHDILNEDEITDIIERAAIQAKDDNDYAQLTIQAINNAIRTRQEDTAGGKKGEGKAQKQTKQTVKDVIQETKGKDYHVGETTDRNVQSRAPIQQLDLFTATKKQADQAVPEIKPLVRNIKTGAMPSGIKKVYTPADAAHVIALLRKEPQESLVALVLDKDHKPIAILRHSIGNIDSATGDPGAIAGAVHALPGAAHVYAAHNHPSGMVTQSQADMRLSSQTAKVFDGSGIQYHGMLVVGNESRQFSFYNGKEWGGYESNDITPKPRKESVDVIERKFRGIRKHEKVAFSDPRSARRFMKDAPNGIALLDTRHRFVHHVPMTDSEMLKLKQSEVGKGSSRLLKAIHEFNAAAAFIKTNDRKAGENITQFLNNTNVRPLDVFEGPEVASVAETGAGPVSGTIFYSNPITAMAHAYQDAADWFIRGIENRLAWTSALGNLEGKRDYLTKRYLALGKITEAKELADKLNAIFSSEKKKIRGKVYQAIPEAQQKVVYEYLTTDDESILKRIELPEIRSKAKAAKKLMNRIGDDLVARGMIPEESREAYKNRYLPRVYLKHLLGEQLASLGIGLKSSPQGYSKPRSEIPAEYRELMGEITDPAYLLSRGVLLPMRDMAILDFLDEVSKDPRWALPKLLVRVDMVKEGDTLHAKTLPITDKGNGRIMSAFALHDESKALADRAKYETKPESAAKMLSLAREYEEIAKKAFDKQGAIPENYLQIPTSKRYGQLRGMWVRKEIFHDVVGARTFAGEAQSAAQKLLGEHGYLEKANRAFKVSKVALNYPSQVRNFVSNGVLLQLSGVPFYRVPDRLMSALREIASNGKYYQIAKKYGVLEATFSNNEMARIQRHWIKLQAENKGNAAATRAWFSMLDMGSAFVNAHSDFYQFSESLFKTAKIIDAMEREGMSEADAAMAAHEALFDYSLVSESVRYLRNVPLGAPFITFFVKSLAQLSRVALKHPMRFLPWMALYAILEQAFMVENDVDEDDLKALQKALPQWLHDKGGSIIWPYRDENGRWQAVDISYFFPWQAHLEWMRTASEGKAGETLKTLANMMSPTADVISAIQTGIDPFTGKQIINPNDPPGKQAGDLIRYSWRLMAPTYMTDIGVVDLSALLTGETGGHLSDALTGKLDPRRLTYGEPTDTVFQGLARIIGVNIYPIDPEKSRAANISRMKWEMMDLKDRTRRNLMDPNLKDERKELIEWFQKEMALRSLQLQQYQAESHVNPKLKKQ